MRKLKNEELNRLTTEEFKQQKKTPIIVILDNVRSMHNVGAAFRTADAFLIEAIYLTGITARPPHREINKTALGATETVKWHYFSTTYEAVIHAKDKGYKIAAIEQADQSVYLNEFTPEQNTPYAFVFGNEVFGVEDEVVEQSDLCIEIPQFGTKHSLNISVSVGVVLWDTISKLRLKKQA
ncbi:MAG: RNA methyltransferase [Cyclobacteriaceae bacterium]|nr:RNA methyltransferase [Cyclobacteriaceae bacterium]